MYLNKNEKMYLCGKIVNLLEEYNQEMHNDFRKVDNKKDVSTFGKITVYASMFALSIIPTILVKNGIYNLLGINTMSGFNATFGQLFTLTIPAIASVKVSPKIIDGLGFSQKENNANEEINDIDNASYYLNSLINRLKTNEYALLDVINRLNDMFKTNYDKLSNEYILKKLFQNFNFKDYKMIENLHLPSTNVDLVREFGNILNEYNFMVNRGFDESFNGPDVISRSK